MNDFPQLPVFHHLDRIAAALRDEHIAVINAEPGAGKTMLVPVLAGELGNGGMTILIEPRRIAARTAAYSIAGMHNFTPGRECGFAVRGEQCRCQSDGILAVTPGIYLQMIQSDPTLEGISAVIFDEFHERSVESDLALALTLDTKESLRGELMLAVMSASMDSERTGEFLRAPVINIPGRGFPVEINYCDTQVTDPREIPQHTAKIILANINNTGRNILVFLPGAEDIRRCRMILENSIDENSFVLHDLHGSMDITAQRNALMPDPYGRRKIILSTNIAESSLTIDGISLVIDSGWEKRAVWHPGAQMTFLETRRITADSAIQRAGRAGRTAPGKAIRCYSRLTFENFSSHRTPEILSADLTHLRLTVACWGAEISALRFIDPPPVPAVKTAENILRKLGLFSADNRPTAYGKRAAALPVSPRIAAMMLFSPPSLRREAAESAAILEEKDDFHRFDTVDLYERIRRMRNHPEKFRIQQSICSRLLKDFPTSAADDNFTGSGIPIALAFPEWVAGQREPGSTVYQLANGSAARLNETDPLRNSEFLAVARLDNFNAGANAVIRLALPLDRESLETFFSDRIRTKTLTVFDAGSGKFSAFEERRFGEITLSRKNIAPDPQEIIPALLKEAVKRNISLPPADNRRTQSLVDRIRFAKSCGINELPEPGSELLELLTPFIPDSVRSFNDLKKIDWLNILHSAIPYDVMHELDRLCPEFFTAPTGMKFAIDYSGEQPTLAIPIQQLYGVNIHPVVGKNQIPLRIELLSPARRPVQVTCDLPGFWQGSWELVRKEMRARYPKHLWHDDPAHAVPMKNSIKK